MTSICPNKLMMMFPLITSLAVNFYMKGWINEWKLEQNTYAWEVEFHIFGFQKLSIKCPWELPQIWLPTQTLYDFVHRDVVHTVGLHESWHKLTAFSKSLFTLDEHKFTVHRSYNPYPHGNTFGISFGLFLQSCQDQSSESVRFHSSTVRCNPIVLLSNH